MSDSGPVTIVLHDRGQVPKIIFASNPLNTKRWVLIDVDDIFVGKNRLSPSDVRELVISQDKLRKNIYGFKYNLGFSGYYFRNQGSSLINKEGDAALIEKKHHFWCRCFLIRKFALEYKLPVNFHYAVAPHHSGVYPVHKPLYDAWKNVWGIVVTSTEEYPHLKPSRLRRGFTHDKLKILPRQTCGLFTKNIYYEDYPKNPEVLEKSIRGGELKFQFGEILVMTVALKKSGRKIKIKYKFFSSSDYLKGIDWYMSFFPDNVKINDTLVFEKSATYFDKGIVPLRVSNLLPEASLISIIISPIKRAYSWYYHSRAHKDPAAISNSFFDIISANSTSSKVVRVLQSRCLEPGKYFLHFERWMHYFKSRKILIIDGEKLRYTPANVMEEIQKFLNIRHIINYEEELVFDPIKGFFCQVSSVKHSKCLDDHGTNSSAFEAFNTLDILSVPDKHFKSEIVLLKNCFGMQNWVNKEIDCSS
ncbi:NDST2 [Lepeophtheirus salmonis]|uniref:[heparan sulfate]-glucosamine N-sulfotransferase n=1 Tax=Lepeophtheirus salmonis TaxID=72036 RepID=A0A7R8CGI5_LEPSM|nr:NDST2 [Lepeophtheirus salmonis]CAF2816327.1 NDST2 [Lepeophtheirus salmonis]